MLLDSVSMLGSRADSSLKDGRIASSTDHLRRTTSESDEFVPRTDVSKSLVIDLDSTLAWIGELRPSREWTFMRDKCALRTSIEWASTRCIREREWLSPPLRPIHWSNRSVRKALVVRSSERRDCRLDLSARAARSIVCLRQRVISWSRSVKARLRDFVGRPSKLRNPAPPEPALQRLY